MIWESADWKKPLLSSAKWLRSVRLSERTRESTYVRIEKEIFFGFYSIRKLFEALKVSDSTRTFMYDLAWYPNRKPVDHLNWHRLGELYDLDRPEEHIGFYKLDQFVSFGLLERTGSGEVVTSGRWTDWPYPQGAFSVPDGQLGDLTCPILSAEAQLDEKVNFHKHLAGAPLREEDPPAIEKLRDYIASQ